MILTAGNSILKKAGLGLNLIPTVTPNIRTTSIGNGDSGITIIKKQENLNWEQN